MKSQTPNALPPTAIQLGEGFNASLTLKAARNVETVSILSIGVRGTKRWTEGGIQYPYHLVDVDTVNEKGERHIIRSRNIHGLKKAIKKQREVTRKIALFLFENKNTKLPCNVNA